jgi:hypothetical protein
VQSSVFLYYVRIGMKRLVRSFSFFLLLCCMWFCPQQVCSMSSVPSSSSAPFAKDGLPEPGVVENSTVKTVRQETDEVQTFKEKAALARVSVRDVPFSFCGIPAVPASACASSFVIQRLSSYNFIYTNKYIETVNRRQTLG